MTSLSLWRHWWLSWPRPALRTYGRLTAFNITEIVDYCPSRLKRFVVSCRPFELVSYMILVTTVRPIKRKGALPLLHADGVLDTHVPDIYAFELAHGHKNHYVCIVHDQCEAKPTIIFPTAEHHYRWPVPNSTARVTEAQCVWTTCSGSLHESGGAAGTLPAPEPIGHARPLFVYNGQALLDLSV